jgi:hypothetical protein
MYSRIGRTAATALLFIALGFVFITLAWNGAARLDYTQGQMPYLLSGGAAGLGFIGLGAAMLLFESGRRATAKLEEKLDELIEVMRNTQNITASAMPTASVPAVKASGARNGNTVIVGRSSFHLPDCRLVEGKDSLEESTRDAAVAQGLQACRVCDPLATARSKR